MPLPAALAAKLAKRGILQQQQQAQKNKEAAPGFVEEVIAENYDDPKKSGGQKVAIGPQPKPATTLSRFHRLGHFGCPNKTNMYHRCVQFCVTHWGRGHSQPDTKYNRRRVKMLKKYPLPPNWTEIYDPGRGRYYYWNTTTDEVSWRSPLHPKAKIGPSAAVLRVKMIEDEHEATLMGPPEPPPPLTSAKLSSKLDLSSNEKFSSVKQKESDSNRYKPYKGTDRRKKDRGNEELDPMDPSSYSDVPRGTWSSGLKEDSEGRTGVDTTASGPLFQMRPYPSPGSILRANAGKKDK